MYSQIMKSQKPEKVQISFFLPRELDEQWRNFVHQKYGLYHRGLMTTAYEKAIKQLIATEGKQ
jgi:hypothetical protein